MKRIIIDASVALKLFLADEEDGEKALVLLDKYVSNQLDILAPSLLESEVVNGLIIAMRRGRVDENDTYKALEGFVDLKIDLRPITSLYPKVLQNSIHYNLSAYDACYLALAESEETHLITADRKFFTSARKNRWIKWLGDI